MVPHGADIDDVPFELRRRVTYHAVTSYVQRVIGITVPIVNEDAPRKLIAKIHCAAANMTIDEVRRAIMKPAVAAGCLAGLNHVLLPHFQAFIADGVVTTIYEARPKQKKRLRAKTKKEAQRFAQRLDRRERRTPSSVRRT